MGDNYQSLSKPLAIQLLLSNDRGTPIPLDLGEVAVIGDDLTASGISTEADVKLLGTVCAQSDFYCTLATRFRERRDDRVAAAVFANGPFVWDATMKAAAYTAGTRGCVIGTNDEPFAIGVGSAGTVTTDNAEPYAIVLNTSDTVKINGETFTLTAGGARTAAQVVADFAGAVSFAATVFEGHVKFSATAIDGDIDVQVVAEDAYTILGLDTVVAAHVAATNLVKLHINTGGSQTFTLDTDATATAQEICDKINATGTGFVASVDGIGMVKLLANSIGDDLILENVTGTANAILGMNAATYAGNAASHSAGAIAGLQIKAPQPLSLRCEAKGPYVITVDVNDTLVITIGAGQAQTFTLTPGLLVSAQDIADEVNSTATDFTATVVKGRLIFTVDTAGVAATITADADSAYSTLGMVGAGTYAAPMTIETLEY